MAGPVGLQGRDLPKSLLHGPEPEAVDFLGKQGHMVVDLTVPVALLEDHHVLEEQRLRPCLLPTAYGASARII